jgi:uncharacterized protein (DUF1778 family)
MDADKIAARQISFRCTVEEHAALTAKAEAVGLSLTAFVKLAALDRRIPVRSYDAKSIVSALSRVGGLLNQLAAKANSNRSIDAAALAVALEELKATITEIGA